MTGKNDSLGAVWDPALGKSKSAWPTWRVPDQRFGLHREFVSTKRQLKGEKKVESRLFNVKGTSLTHFPKPGSVSHSSAPTQSVIEGEGSHPNPI